MRFKNVHHTDEEGSNREKKIHFLYLFYDPRCYANND